MFFDVRNLNKARVTKLSTEEKNEENLALKSFYLRFFRLAKLISTEVLKKISKLVILGTNKWSNLGHFLFLDVK